MARVVTDHVWPIRRTRKFPTSQWFDGQIWELTEEDFQGYSIESVATRLKMYASWERIGIRIHVDIDNNKIYVMKETNNP